MIYNSEQFANIWSSTCSGATYAVEKTKEGAANEKDIVSVIILLLVLAIITTNITITLFQSLFVTDNGTTIRYCIHTSFITFYYIYTFRWSINGLL